MTETKTISGFLNWIGDIKTSKSAKGVVKRRSIGLAVQGQDNLVFVTLFADKVTAIDSIPRKSRIELSKVTEQEYEGKTSYALGKFGSIKLLSAPKTTA